MKDVSEDAELYADVLPTWLFAGNFIDVAFNRSTGGQSLRQNTAGALSPAIFAELFDDENGNPQTESAFDKTDSFGNQYRIQLTDFNQPENDNPFQPEPPVDDGGGTGEEGPVEEGDPPAPEDDLWPGVPF